MQKLSRHQAVLNPRCSTWFVCNILFNIVLQLIALTYKNACFDKIYVGLRLLKIKNDRNIFALDTIEEHNIFLTTHITQILGIICCLQINFFGHTKCSTI